MFTVHTFVLCFVFTMKLPSTQFSHFQTQSLVPLLLKRCHTKALMSTGHMAYNVPFFFPSFTPTPTYTVILPAASALSPTKQAVPKSVCWIEDSKIWVCLCD